MEANGGKLTDDIYYQIDGGSKNANGSVLVFGEIIVAKRLCKILTVTRLPVGHTHEDIDAKFGVIWTRNRGQHIQSPQIATKLIMQSFKETSSPVKVVDVFVVPDYTAYIAKFIDKSLSRAHKLDWTQLQWIFESVPISPQFSSGVKVTYRAYSSDVAYEIIDRDTLPLHDSLRISPHGIPYAPVRTQVRTYPEGGLSILKALPTGTIEHASFVQ